MPHQVLDFQTALSVLLSNMIHLNFSPVGTGKTFCAMWLAQQLGLDIIVFAPRSMIEVWNRELAHYGINIASVKHKSKKGTESVRKIWTYNTASNTSKEEFLRKFTPCIKKGTLFVFDEFQNIKNSSASCTQNIAELLRLLTAMGGPSRATMMSATPIDMPYQCIPILYMLGFVSLNIADNPEIDMTRRARPEKAEAARSNRIELQEFLDRLNEEDGVYGPLIRNLDAYIDGDIVGDYEYCYQFLRLYVIPSIATRMPAVKKAGISQRVINVFCPIKDKEYENSLDELNNRAIGELEGRKGVKVNSKATFQQLLAKIERMKLPNFVSTAFMYLEKPTSEEQRAKDPDSSYKIVIVVNFLENLSILAAYLAIFNPLIMYGDTTAKERDKKIAMFQSPNSIHRVLLMTKVGSVGVTLDDQHSTRPRVMLLSPGVSILDTIQSLGRIYRAGTMSDAIVIMIYGIVAGKKDSAASNMELNIRRRLETKNSTVVNTIKHSMSPNDMMATNLIVTLSDAEYKILIDGEFRDYHVDDKELLEIENSYLEDIIQEKRCIVNRLMLTA